MPRPDTEKTPRALLAVLIGWAVLCVYWGSAQFIQAPHLSHNMLANQVMGAAPLYNMGVPYRDWWDIYPPGIYLFMGLMEQLFSGAPVYFKLLHLFCMTALIVLIGRILHAFEPLRWKSYSAFFLALAAFLLNSFHLNSIFCSTVLLGSFLSVAALSLLLFSKKDSMRYGLTTLLIVWAGFFKDPFFFLLPLPFVDLAARKWMNGEEVSVKRALGWISSAALSVVGVHLAYLLYLGILGEFLEVLRFKMMYFGVSKRAAPALLFADKYFNYVFLVGTATLVLFSLAAAYAVLEAVLNALRETPMRVPGPPVRETVVVCFFLLNWFAFKMQGRVSHTYALQMTAPLVLLLFLIVKYFLARLPEGKKILSAVSCAVLLLVLIPHREAWASYFRTPLLSPRAYVEGLMRPEDFSAIPEIPDRVKAALPEDRRMLILYGWNTPFYYYHWRVKPYSRYFIVHPQIMSAREIREWARTFHRALPKVVWYHAGPDTDIDEVLFERITVRVKALLEACYEKVGSFYVLPGEDCELFRKQEVLFIHPQLLEKI